MLDQFDNTLIRACNAESISMPRRRHDHFSFHLLFRTLNYGLWESPKSGPVYVDDGAKCGENKACLDMDCLDKDEVYATLVSVSIK